MALNLTTQKHITQFKARNCRNAGLSLPEAEALNFVLSHPSQDDFERSFGYRLITRLEKRGYITFDGVRWQISQDGFRALEHCCE